MNANTAPRTLAELDAERVHIEDAITRLYGTEKGSAANSERIALLHDELVALFREIERVSWSQAGNVAGTLRWAITGAKAEAKSWRDSADVWRGIEAREVIARGGQI